MPIVLVPAEVPSQADFDDLVGRVEALESAGGGGGGGIGFGLHVDDFGAVGDGVADDAAAFTDAIAALPAQGGRVLMGNKVYRLGATITLDKRVTLAGHGTTQTVGDVAPTRIMKAASLDGTLFDITADSCTLRDFHMRGESGNGGVGVAIEAARVVLRDLTVSHVGGTGVRLGDPAGIQNCNYCRLDNLYLSANGANGLVIDDAVPNANAGTGINVIARDNASDGIHIDRANSWTLIGGGASNNGGNGLRLNANSKRCVVSAGNWEQNGLKDILISAGALDHVLIKPSVDAADTLDSGTGTTWI